MITKQISLWHSQSLVGKATMGLNDFQRTFYKCIMNMFVKISYVLLIFRLFCFLFDLNKPNADEADRNIKTLLFYLFLLYVFPAINSSVVDPDLRIRIRIKHFKRVRNRFRRRILIRFRIRFRIQGFDDQKLKKKKYS
jgi:hypothetical protein